MSKLERIWRRAESYLFFMVVSILELCARIGRASASRRKRAKLSASWSVLLPPETDEQYPEGTTLRLTPQQQLLVDRIASEVKSELAQHGIDPDSYYVDPGIDWRLASERILTGLDPEAMARIGELKDATITLSGFWDGGITFMDHCCACANCPVVSDQGRILCPTHQRKDAD